MPWRRGSTRASDGQRRRSPRGETNTVDDEERLDEIHAPTFPVDCDSSAPSPSDHSIQSEARVIATPRAAHIAAKRRTRSGGIFCEATITSSTP